MKNTKILILVMALFLAPNIWAQEEVPAAEAPQEVPAEQEVQAEKIAETPPVQEIRVERAMVKIETQAIKIESAAMLETAQEKTGVAGSVMKIETSADFPKVDNTFYFSTRFEFGAGEILNLFSRESYSTDKFGLAAEFGWIINKLFASGSVNFLPEFIGGGVSFGTRAQPHEKIQIITGGTGGYWEEDDNKFFGGVFAKALFGKKKWLEIQNRVLLGYGDLIGKKHLAAAYEIGIGFTITK